MFSGTNHDQVQDQTLENPRSSSSELTMKIQTIFSAVSCILYSDHILQKKILKKDPKRFIFSYFVYNTLLQGPRAPCVLITCLLLIEYKGGKPEASVSSK